MIEYTVGWRLDRNTDPPWQLKNKANVLFLAYFLLFIILKNTATETSTLDVRGSGSLK